MLRFSGEKGREALCHGVAEGKKPNNGRGNREEAVPLERRVDQIHAKGAEADPQDVFPLIADNTATTVAARCVCVDHDGCEEERQICHPERRIKRSKISVQDGEEVLPGPTKHLVLTR